MDCPLWVGTPSHTEREKAGKKGPLMKGQNPAPTCTPFLPPSFPCPVELIWQRGASISQFTLAAAFLVLRRLSVALPVSLPPYTSPHPLLCVYTCLQCLCVHSCCCACSGGIMSCTVTWKTVQALGLATPASYQLRYCHLHSCAPSYCAVCLWYTHSVGFHYVLECASEQRKQIKSPPWLSSTLPPSHHFAQPHSGVKWSSLLDACAYQYLKKDEKWTTHLLVIKRTFIQ